MSDTQPRFCYECGAGVNLGGKFCGQCGTSLQIEQLAEQNSNPSPADTVRALRNTAAAVDTTTPPALHQKSPLAHPALFFILYVVVMLPTYILPYVGSNSTAVNSVTAAAGAGLSLQFWLHFTALYLLIVIAWFRGALLGRSWLAALPAIAGVFDLMPGLNWLPLAPTMFHVAALIAGVTKEPLAETTSSTKRWIASVCGFFLLILIIA